MFTKRGGGNESMSSSPDEEGVGQAFADTKVQKQLQHDELPTENMASLGTVTSLFEDKKQPFVENLISESGRPSSGETSEGQQKSISRPIHEIPIDPPRITPVISADSADKSRQVIAVSASKGPAAFFNLARKFLVTDEMCDLSALEGAIVSAVDAAHLLERSKLATIVRIHTSYVTVEPKQKKIQPSPSETSHRSFPPQPVLSSAPSYAAKVAGTEGTVYAASPSKPGPPRSVGYSGAPRAFETNPPGAQKGSKGSGSRELRRARIVITVQRTEGYKLWLEENPLQAVLAGDVDEDIVEPQQDI